MSKYETVMGLEVHIELSTESKLFCSCSTKFGAAANENVCPACSGMPGMPAVLNKRAVELGIIAGIVTNCEISKVTSFDKKNYFYPDLPTGYQITQIFAPICKNGYIDIDINSTSKRITLKQIHIEEDAGKLIHDRSTTNSLIDFNRASVPLVEIVSNPDFRTSEEVVAYLEKLRSLLSFAGVSDCKMQEGSMRCDVNISVREEEQSTLGTRVEIKNMNSYKAIANAIAYESQRHIDALTIGNEEIIQETRRWDDNIKETFPMRDKEDATDYRYFKNSEIMPLCISDEWVETLRKDIPEMAHQKFERMTKKLKLSEYDANIITSSKNLSNIFDSTLNFFNNPKEVVNWITVELLGMNKTENKGDDDIVIDCFKFAKLIEMVDNKTINRNIGKKLLTMLVEEDTDPVMYVQTHNLGMINDVDSIGTMIEQVLSQNQKVVEEYLGGNQKIFGFLVGQVMKNLGGKADPVVVNQILKERLQS